MIDADSERDPVDVLAEEFAARHRRGENPRLGEYIERHPELAEQIRQTFPAVMMLEQFKPARNETPVPSFNLDRLGEYRIIREVGRGGMGVVYEAEQPSLGRRVALKVLAGASGFTPNALRRFTLEARAAARLHHTNIVPVFGVGTDQGIHYYVMQLIEGRGIDSELHDLRRMRGRHAPAPVVSGSATTLTGDGQQYWRNVARVTAQAADALHYAHQAGTLHRDIKPSNLLLDPSGTVWVSDFGLAKLHDEPDITRTTDVIGTVRYMAPERFGGTCNARSDIYSLGLVLYELLTLRPAYEEADRSRLVHQITHQSPRRPREIAPDVPRDLETIALKAIAREPRDRYGSAQALADDLRRFLEDRPIQARPISRVERLRRWCHRNPLPASLAACVAVLLVSTAIASTIVAFRYRRLAADEQTARHDADDARHAAEAALAEVYPNNGIAASRRGNAAEAMLWFAAAAKLSPPGSDAAALNLMRVRTWGESVLSPVAFVPSRVPPDGQLVFHPDGEHLLIRGRDFAEIWDVVQGRRISLPTGLGKLVAGSWSEDGRQLVIADADGTVRVLSFPELAKQFEVKTELGTERVAFSPQSRWLLVSRGKVEQVWDCASQAAKSKELIHPDVVTSATFSGDGSLLVTGCRDGQARVFQVDGAAAPLASAKCDAAIAPVWGDDDRFLCSAGNSLTWHEARSGATVATSELGEPIRWVAADAQGHRIVAGVGNRAVVLDGSTAAQVGTVGGGAGVLRRGWVSPDGLAVLTINDELSPTLWSLPTGVRDQAALGQLKPVATAAFSADSHLLALVHPDGAIRIFARPVAMSPVYRLPLSGGTSAARFDRTGTLVMPIGTGTPDGALRSTQVYDVRTGRALGPPLTMARRICGGDFAPDDTHLVTVGMQEDEWCAQFWDWRRGAPGGPPVPLPERPVGVEYDPTGRSVAVLGAAGKLVFLDANKNAILRTWQTARRDPNSNYILHHGGLAFSPDGQSILTWGTTSAERWDASTGRRRWPAIVHEGLCSDACFSPDGRYLATAGWDGTARVWDAATGSPQSQPLAHPSQVFSVQFMPGDRLLTGCADGTARVWDWRAGRLVHALYRDDQYAYGAAATPEGRWVITGSGGKSARVWDAASGNPVTPAIPVSSLPWIIETTPDGRHATIAGFTGVDVLALPLPNPSDSPLWAETRGELSANARLERGAVVPLSLEEWSRRLDRLRPTLQRPGTDAIAWHRQAASAAGEARDAYAALDHLQKVIDAGAADWSELEEAAGGYGVLNRWHEAEALFAKVVAVRPQDWELRLDHGDSLTALGRMDDAASEFSQAAKLRGSRTWAAGNWWAISPYRPTLHDPLPPERQTDVGKPVPSERPDDHAAPTRWRLLKNNSDSVSLTQSLQIPPHVTSFALTHVFSAIPQEVALSLGSDDLCRVWVNGDMIYEYDGPARTVKPDQGARVVTLRAGWNTILAKLVSIGSEQSLYARLSDRPIDLALAFLHQKQPDKALEQYTIGLAQRPRTRDLLAARADLLGQLGRFKEAAEDLTVLTEIDPAEQWNWYRLGSLRLQLEDVPGYQRICGEVLKRWGETNDPILAERTAKLCSLTPDGAADPKALVALVEKSVVAGSDVRWLAWFHTSTGMAHYRAGHYAEAVDWLDKAIRANAGADVESMALVFTAMAQARLGRMDEARRSLDRAEAGMKPFAEPGKPLDPAWNDWINFHVALREARAMVK